MLIYGYHSQSWLVHGIVLTTLLRFLRFSVTVTCSVSDQTNDHGVDVAPCTGLKTRRQRLRISEADAQESVFRLEK